MAEIITPEFHKIVDGILGSEGPVFDKNGQFYCVDPDRKVGVKHAGRLLNMNIENGQYTTRCEPQVDGYGGVPAGCNTDHDNSMLVADMRLGILRVQQDGSFRQLAKSDISGRTMQGCNDCIFDYTGTLWITAPAGEIAPAEYRRSFDEPFGSIYCLTPEGLVNFLETGFYFCNGIGVQHTADGKPSKLIVAETPKKSLWSYDIVGPAQVRNKQLWGRVPGTHEGGPDGMDFDEEGYLLVANWGSSHIEVYGPNGGDPVARIKCPFKNPSNVHFKPNSNEVYVTEHEFNGVWKFTWRAKGAKQWCEL